RPNKVQNAGLVLLGKVCVLGRQPVAGMECINIVDFRRADGRGNIEVTLCELRRADTNSLISKAHVQRIAVGLAVNRNRADAQLLASANYPQSDFTAVSNQDLLEHLIGGHFLCSAFIELPGAIFSALLRTTPVRTQSAGHCSPAS